jgi:hypothetical protein
MNTRSLLLGLLVPVLLALSPLARADYTPCPGETTWKVTTPLPDPWSSTDQTSSLSKQFTVLINAVEWLVCSYSHRPGEPSVFGRENGKFRVRLQRPKPLDYGSLAKNDICPTNTITTEVVSPVPAPWKSTKYVWTLEGTSVTEIGGQDLVLCTYTAPMDSQNVGPSSVLRPLNLEGQLPLAPTPKPGPQLPGSLAAEFAVTNVSLATVPAARQRACPAPVSFQGSITVNGPGEVIYRYVDNKGVAGPQKKLTFTQAGTKPVAFQITVDAPETPPSAQPGSLATTPTPAGPQIAAASGGGVSASSNIAAPSTPNTQWGFQRIEILAPTGGKTKSQDAAWSVQCSGATLKTPVNRIKANPRKEPPEVIAPKTAPPTKPRDNAKPKGTGK